MNENLIESYGDELYNALRSRTPVEPLTDRESDITIEDAYHISLQMVNRRVEAGERIIGKKIGVTSAAVQNMLNVHQPDFGYLTDSMVYSSELHQSKVLAYFKNAIDEGANLVTGGGIPDMPEELAGGYWIQPTIWTGLPEDATVVREEIFGPVCHITPFDKEEEAIQLANDTPYGLAATLWTENISRAHRVAGKLEAGIVWVNSWFLRDLRTPFGGSKQSGIGREGGVHSLEFYTELKNVCVKL